MPILNVAKFNFITKLSLTAKNDYSIFKEHTINQLLSQSFQVISSGKFAYTYFQTLIHYKDNRKTIQGIFDTWKYCFHPGHFSHFFFCFLQFNVDFTQKKVNTHIYCLLGWNILIRIYLQPFLIIGKSNINFTSRN